MWPSQCADAGYAYDADAVARCCSEILSRASQIIARQQWTRRYIVFPIFLAGIFTAYFPERKTAMDLLRAMELTSIGSNTRATRKWLERIWADEQQTGSAALGRPTHGNWVQMINDVGDFSMVHLGL